MVKCSDSVVIGQPVKRSVIDDGCVDENGSIQVFVQFDCTDGSVLGAGNLGLGRTNGNWQEGGTGEEDDPDLYSKAASDCTG